MCGPALYKAVVGAVGRPEVCKPLPCSLNPAGQGYGTSYMVVGRVQEEVRWFGVADINGDFQQEQILYSVNHLNLFKYSLVPTLRSSLLIYFKKLLNFSSICLAVRLMFLYWNVAVTYVKHALKG